jgi:hypothetical protein
MVFAPLAAVKLRLSDMADDVVLSDGTLLFLRFFGVVLIKVLAKGYGTLK